MMLGLTGAGLVVTATSAAAHDELMSTTPAAQDEIAALPTAVTLRFVEAPLDLGAKLRVVGPSGDVTDGPALITGHSVRQPIDPSSPAGAYTVQWRVTSYDGHPISGKFSFTAATGGPDATAAPSPTVSSATAQPVDATATATPAAAAPVQDAGSAGFPWAWLVGGAAVLAALLAGFVKAGKKT
jgi:copper resistance protein C